MPQLLPHLTVDLKNMHSHSQGKNPIPVGVLLQHDWGQRLIPPLDTVFLLETVKNCTLSFLCCTTHPLGGKCNPLAVVS